MKKTIALLLTLCAVMIPFTAFADGNDYEGTGNSQTAELIGQPNSDSPSTKSVVVPGGTANLTAMSGGQLHWRVTSTLGNILGFEGNIDVYKAGKIVSSQFVSFRLAGTTKTGVVSFKGLKKGSYIAKFKGKGVCTGGIILFSSPAEASFTIR
ncbi:TPA: hypothetical protein KNI19_003641 [Clostridioides difficile]|nr:hypothetical protein [Clostridioides difficile]